MAVCDFGFILNGNALSFCNGTDWDRPLGKCIEDATTPMNCDFETKNLCGWQTELSSSFEWKRRNGWVSFERLDYGPKHDHTVKRANFQ